MLGKIKVVLIFKKIIIKNSEETRHIVNLQVIDALELQGIGTSGKGYGFGGISIGSMVWISLGAKNSLGLAPQRITQSMWRGRFARIQGLSNMDEYMNWPCFQGVFHH